VSSTTTHGEHAATTTPEDYRIPARSPWRRAWIYPAGVGALGAGIAVVGYRDDPSRFPFAYLFGFFVALSLALGNLFFILVLYLAKASWGISVRRVAELYTRRMAIFAVLVIPLIASLGTLFPWAGAPVRAVTSAEHEGPIAQARGIAALEPAAMRERPLADAARMTKAEDEGEKSIIDHKRPYLNRVFFLIRLMGYLVLWTWIAHRYFQWSTDQDSSRSLSTTARAQRFAPGAVILFGLTLTFFAFDWLLSLDGTWYSTMFGVQVFAQCALIQMATLVLSLLLFRRTGLLRESVTVEHFHDLGKLLFGWICFWSYVTFSQFFLTWYSNIPDEVSWFHKRWDDNDGTWLATSILLVAMHFFVPFWFLMSRNIKRRLPLLGFGAGCMVIMHVIEVYWIVMPNYGPLNPSLLDVGCLLALVGIYLATVLHGIEEYPLIPIGDPRLMRSLEFENA
jgi:hypothetical protein